MHYQRKKCLIIGAGVSGLVQAAEILRKGVLEQDELQLLERADDFGGVWTAATYPGAACDVFSILYQVSWFRNDWSGLFPHRDELVSYYNRFADHFGIRQFTSFGQHIMNASWSEDELLWIVKSRDVRSGEETLWRCDVLVQAVGTYNRKKYPSIPGIEKFGGDVWHTVDWPVDYDFTGKKVAYIGSGPTALQALPAIQPQVKSLTIYMRSMTHCHPFPHITYPGWLRWCFSRLKGLSALYALIVSCAFGFWAWFVFRPGSFFARQEERYCKTYLERQIKDPVLREKLRATGRFGSKRPLVSPLFFKLVQENNVEVATENLIEVDQRGIKSTSRETSRELSKREGTNVSDTQLDEAPEPTIHREFDTIIWGTGFVMQGWGSMVPTTGIKGKLLSDHWEHRPRTLYGTMTSNFPNLMIVNGPNTVAPWASIIKGIEYQTSYTTKLMELIFKRRRTSSYCIMPTPSAELEWTSSMDAPLDALATSTRFGPGFYYLSKSGHNTFFFPFILMYYWWRTRRVRMVEYETWCTPFAS